MGRGYPQVQGIRSIRGQCPWTNLGPVYTRTHTYSPGRRNPESEVGPGPTTSETGVPERHHLVLFDLLDYDLNLP